MGLGLDPLPEALGQGELGAEEMQGPAHVEERFVNAHRLDVRGELLQDAEDRLRGLLIGVHSDGEIDGLGAASPGFADGHGTADAEAAGLVGAGGDHAPASPALGVGADHDGLPAQPWLIALLDRGEEGVHVEVDDDALGHGRLRREGGASIVQAPQAGARGL